MELQNAKIGQKNNLNRLKLKMKSASKKRNSIPAEVA
jgi:hypothetical protein